MKKHSNDLIGDIVKAFGKYADRPAFVIEDTACTYGELATCVQKISSLFKDREDKIIGIVAENRLETYASILSALICGKAYVILHPSYPKHRNDRIAGLAGIRLVLHTKNIHVLNLDTRNLELICTSEIEQAENSTTFHAAEDILHTAEEENAYIIFTSGSTGEPKGVPISRRNLNAFYTAYHRLGWQLDENDRMLQMFELTFDVSIVSFLYPLVVTAEASDAELLGAFRKCVPNASFINLYGPTEGTIYCTAYRIPVTSCKHHNGMTAIGRPFEGIDALIMDNDGRPLPTGETGELWISGNQVMGGYWNAPEKNGECLVETANGKVYYKTGDLCRMDADGDIIYCGRKDSQIKIQGFRIELSEIEHVAKNFFNGECRVVVIPKYDNDNQCELHLVVEKKQLDKQQIEEYLCSRLPYYMIPKHMHCLEQFPLNTSSKTDRKKIQELI